MRMLGVVVWVVLQVLPSYAQSEGLRSLQAYRIVLASEPQNSLRFLQLSQELHEELILLQDHYLDEEDRYWFGYQAKMEELVAKQERLSQLEEQLVEYDKQWFPNLKSVTQTKRGIKALKKEIDLFVQESPNYSIKSVLPIAIDLRPALPREALAEGEIGVAFWIYAEFRELDNATFYYHLRGYDAQEMEEITLYRGIVRWDEREMVIRKSLDSVRHRLLGRSWAAIEIRELPMKSSFRVQWQDVQGIPRMAATERRHLENLLVDEGRLRAHVVGFRRQEWSMALENNTRHEVSFSSQAIEDDDRFIRTTLDNAEIYVDGVYQGQAPMTVQAREGQTITLVDRSKSRPPVIYTVKEQDEEIFMPFSLPIAEQNRLIKAQEHRFYLWAGGFILSLLAPVILFNVYLDYAQKAAYLDYNWHLAEAARATRSANLYRNLTIGGGVVSVGVLGFTIYELYKYVKISSE
jgi:hypothetical protein